MLARRKFISSIVLVYIALCLSLLISKQAARIATDFNLNPRLFTAHYSAEVYRELDDPFKPRLFAYLLAAPFIKLDQQASHSSSLGRISAPAVERLVAGWSFAWFFATALLCLGTNRPLLYLFGTAAGVSFAYSLQEMVYPYDLPALFFATLVFVVVLKQRHSWLPWILAVGTGFKETIVVFAFTALFMGSSRKERFQALSTCLVACLIVMMAIDLYSGRGFFALEAFTKATDASDPSSSKILLNLKTALDPLSLVWFVNAGLALPLFLLPTRGDRLAQGFRSVGLLFAAGLFSFAGVGELRIWFELIPFCLYNLVAFLESPDDKPHGPHRTRSPALDDEAALAESA